MALNPDAMVGRAIGPYALSRLIGQGGFAWVFAARRATDDRPAALKLLKPLYSVDPEFVRRFLSEARIAAKLDHPNIVRILDVGQADGFAYFSMQLYGDGLRRRLEQQGPLAEPDLYRLAAELGAGLAFAHAQGIMHRDVKVDNVLFADDGRAVLTDFGIARAISGYVSATGPDMTIGTPHYISPEQAQGKPTDERSDLYALGVTLYRAATGDMPFRSSDWFELARMHVEAHPPAPRSRRRELSGAFEQVILRCLAKTPEHRYPSAAALVHDLQRLTDRTAPTATGRARRWWWWVGGVVVAAALAALVALLR